MKTISEKLREHALGPLGGHVFGCIEDKGAWHAAVIHLQGFGFTSSSDLSCDERRMFCLFVAEALEQS